MLIDAWRNLSGEEETSLWEIQICLGPEGKLQTYLAPIWNYKHTLAPIWKLRMLLGSVSQGITNTFRSRFH